MISKRGRERGFKFILDDQYLLRRADADKEMQ